MHHAGGSGSWNAASRRVRVRQRGTACLALSIISCVVGHTSHSRAVPSDDAATTRRPSGLNAALHTTPSWPLSTPISLRPSTSHSRAVPSDDAVTTRRPSGLNAALHTTPSSTPPPATPLPPSPSPSPTRPATTATTHPP